MTALLLRILLFWFGAVYELGMVSYGDKTVSQYSRHSCLNTFWFLFTYLLSGTYIVRPHPDYGTHKLLAAMSSVAMNTHISRSSTIVSTN